METYWIPGANHRGQYGRCVFIEFTAVYKIEQQFRELVEERMGQEQA